MSDELLARIAMALERIADALEPHNERDEFNLFDHVSYIANAMIKLDETGITTYEQNND
jgi:hypothetical protein